VSLPKRATDLRNPMLRRSKFTPIGCQHLHVNLLSCQDGGDVPRPGRAASDKAMLQTLPDKFSSGGRFDSPAASA